MASPSVICYPQPGKAISSDLLHAFASGAGGIVFAAQARQLSAGPAAFYGVIGLEHLLKQARAEGRDWYYGDNAYFDSSRGSHYRFSKNSFQCVDDSVEPDYERLAATRMKVMPWRGNGKTIVLVEQSEHFFNLSCAGRDWVGRVSTELRKHTDRSIIVRRWSRDKRKASATLRADLEGAWALVTHMSAAANEALMFGVPVFATGQCAASKLSLSDLSLIETPKVDGDRDRWAAQLAARQWTIEEVKQGKAWRALNE